MRVMNGSITVGVPPESLRAPPAQPVAEESPGHAIHQVSEQVEHSADPDYGARGLSVPVAVHRASSEGAGGGAVLEVADRRDDMGALQPGRLRRPCQRDRLLEHLLRPGRRAEDATG